MAKFYFIGLLLMSCQIRAQQFGLFNTNTLFDAFENPAQKTLMYADSRQYASNFFLPYLGINVGNRGDASYSLQRKLNDGAIETRNLPIGTGRRNKLYGSSNMYLLTFRTSPFYENNEELGFSWQLRSDVYANYTNETLVALRNYGRFKTSENDLFNGNGHEQSYHQWSANYRVDYGDGISWGLKFGILSGVTYHKADVTQSSLTVTPDQLSVRLTGNYKASFLLTEELHRETLLPNFKNPGLSVSIGATYTSLSDVFLMANVKDLGFIRWNKSSSSVVLNNNLITLNAGNTGVSKDFQRRIVDLLARNNQHKAFYTPTNAKVDVLISKTYDFYTPDFIVSKSLFYNGADVVLVNNFRMEEFTFSISPAFNMNQLLFIGAQGLYQSANLEFFAGTDNLLRSAVVLNSASYSSRGIIGASLYMGVGIRFGRIAGRR